MSDSILVSVKKALHINPDDDSFDMDVIMHINSALSVVQQLGHGPEEGFQIEDAGATWTDLYGDRPRLNSIRTYVYQKVRLAFDPPQTAHQVSAIKEQIRESEWRLSVLRENDPLGLDDLDPEEVT